MKRILAITSLIILFGSLPLQAAPVSISKAMDIASKVFAAQSTRKAANSALKMIWDGEDIATKATQPAFFVIARDGGGFVIVAGDDNVPPILAISDRNEFKVEGMPENVKWWMDRMKASVRSAKVPSPEARAQWAKFAGTKAGAAITGTVTVISEHLTPEWDQLGTLKGRPVYNSKCPIVDGKYTLTGCAATAAGELMTTLSGIYPNQMPVRGEGTVPPYEPWEGCVSASTPEHPYVLGTAYDWAGLRSLSGREAIEKAIAEGRGDLVDNMDQLLADLGATLQSHYAVDGTSVNIFIIADALIRYYGFNKNAYLASASDYTRHQWREKLKGELAVRPLFYIGFTEDGTGGHGFLFDAYGQFEGEDVFHINFGWNGDCNGYYYEGNYDTDGNPYYNYSWYNFAVFDLYPDPSSTYRSNIKLVPVDKDTPFGLSYVGGAPVTKGDLLLIDWFRVSNKGNETFDGKLRVVALNQNGDVLQVFDESDRKDSPLPPRTNFGWCFSEEDDIHILFDISLGDRIVLQYPVDDENTLWQKVEGSVAADSFIDELPLIPLAFIRTEDSYKVGDWFEFALMNHDQIYAGTRWTFTDPDGKAVTIDQSEWEFQLTKKGLWIIEAAVAPEVGAAPVKTLTTYIEVK
jgi:hypothetical protein